MIQTQQTSRADGRIEQYRFLRDGAPLTYEEVLTRWEGDDAFRSMFIEIIAECRFAAVRWETPPINVDNVDRAFECVLIDSPHLSVHADPRSFQEHLAGAHPSGGEVVTFANLGGDATLVVPRPITSVDGYPHLAAFTRDAPKQQQHTLWAAVARAARERLDSRPVWINTAGAGVPWLHIRLDDRPKYYAHAPYRTWR